MKSAKSLFITILIISALALNFDLHAQLTAESNQADYIIITPSELTDAIQPFADWRQNKDLNVATVELQQIFSEFPDSTPQSSIRDFVSHTLTYWNDPKPMYLLLVGSSKYIPSFRVPSTIFDFLGFVEEDSVSIDEWYAVNIFDEDTEPDIAIGRFPVNDINDLNNIIQKTIHFEDSLKLKDYLTEFLFLTDKQDSLIFERDVNHIIDWYIPEKFSIDTIFARQDSTIEETRKKLFSALNNDALFFSYFGHGAAEKFSRYDILTYADINTLNISGKPFILTSAACSQPFDAPNDSSMVRKLIVQPGSGTVASVNSTGLNFLSQGSRFVATFYTVYFDTANVTIGEAVLNTKLQMMSKFNNPVDAISRRYTLLGDPALKLPLHTVTQIVKRHTEMPDAFQLNQNFPNPFNPFTTIKYSLPVAAHVSIKIYDILGRELAVLVDEKKLAGEYSLIFNGTNLSSGIYFYRLQAADFVAVKKFVLTK